MIPKPLRDALGLVAGAKVDISLYGTGLSIIPGGRTARIVRKDGHLVAASDTVFDNETVLRLIDEGR